MRIKETAIDGFGKFHNFHTELSDGIQVIYGKNETGKTTLRQFMFHMLFGLEKSRGAAARRDDYTRYMPVEGGRYGGYLILEKDEKTYRIQRSFDTGNRELRLFLEDTMEEIPLPEQTLRGILFENSAEAFQNTASLTQADIRTGKEMQKILQNSMANLRSSQDAGLDIRKAVDLLKGKRRDARKDPAFRRVEQLRQRLGEVSFQETELKKYEAVEEQLYRQLEQKPKLSLLQRILQWIRRLFGVDQEEIRKNEIRHKLEVVRLEKEHLLEQKQAIEHLKQEYQSVMEGKKEAEQEIRWMERAIWAIETAAADVQKTFGEELNEKISDIFCRMTGGRYEKAVMDQSMEMMVKRNGRYIDMKYLSNGAVEQLYFALRLAAGELLYEGDHFPLFLDDVFGNYDDERLKNTLSYLAENCGRQIMIFTGRRESLRTLEKSGIDFHTIIL